MRFFTYILSDGTAIKIGNTQNHLNLFNRIKSFQTGNPRKIKIIGGFVTDIETELHRKYDGFRLKGEWFENVILTDLMIDYQPLFKGDFLRLLRDKT